MPKNDEGTAPEPTCQPGGAVTYEKAGTGNKSNGRKRTTRPRWRPIGAARRWGDAIAIGIIASPSAGNYVIAHDDVPRLLLDGMNVDIWQISDYDSSSPFVVGTARWTQSGRMIVLNLPGQIRYGGVQVIGADLCAHYLRNDRAPVDVVAPPDPDQDVVEVAA